MKLESNTVLITGGASGIGLTLAERFLAANNTVIICGRRENKLDEAKAQHPALHTRVCDLASEAGREALAAWAVEKFPDLNVLVNNAGVQQRLQLAAQPPWPKMREELAINLDAPLHLSVLLLPHLLKRSAAAVVNVTSGLAFVPLVNVPVYCSTKAALHSFTLSLRRQLAGTSVEVIEILPPAVDTDLGGAGLHTHGVSRDEFANAVWAQLQAGSLEAAYGFAAETGRATREQLDQIFNRMNAPR